MLAGRTNILLVDDLPENLLALEAVLDDGHYNLVSAKSGEEALKRLLQDDYAVILLDVMMPGLDGFETAELIRQRERSSHTPIIFVTAIGKSEMHVFRGYSVGAVDYLFKPLVPEILQSKVATFVDLFEKTQEIKRQAEQLRQLERREHEARLTEAQRQLETERYRQEMRVAREIHRSLFPSGPPVCPGLDIWGASYPADATGGDYFDYFRFDNGTLDVVIGDVSGHGYGPALIMSATRAYLRGMAMTRAGVSQMMIIANRAIAADAGDGRFVTLMLTRLDLETRQLIYSGAGHPPGYVLSSTGQVKATLESKSLPLGIAQTGDFSTSERVALEAGDILFLYTDGLTEALGADEQQFGIERALEVIRKHQQKTSQEIVAELFQANRRYAEHRSQADDITMVVIRVES